MSILALHAAIRALRPGSPAHHEGQAPSAAVAPWIVTGFDTPEIEVSEAVTQAAKTGTITVTVSALTESQANFIADDVDAAFVGARVAVEGYEVGALTPGTRRGPYPAGRTATDTNLAYQVIRQSYRFTYSRTPA